MAALRPASRAAWPVRQRAAFAGSAAHVATPQLGHRSHTTVPDDSELGSIVDVARYPVRHLRSERGREVITRAREALKAIGCASFPGFLTPAAVESAAEEARRASPHAFETDSWHNAYQLPEEDPSLPPRHARNLKMRTRVASIAYDELKQEGTLRRLYKAGGLVDFVGAVLGRRLHRLADPLGACSVNIFRPGWHHAWHFDEAEYTTTLCLQTSDVGGEFEYSKAIRSNRSELADTYASVSRIINAHSSYNTVAGDVDECDDHGKITISTAPFEPGTLQIFAGRYALHRVKSIPKNATRERLVGVLCFASTPGVMNSPPVQKMFWGRTS